MRISKTNKLLIFLLLMVASAGAMIYRTGDAHDRVGPMGDVKHLNPQYKKAFSETEGYMEKLPPNPGDWLAHHKEKGQTYGAYLNSKPNLPDRQRNVLYVVPLGEFGEEAPSLEILLEYTEAYYAPMKVKMLDPVPAHLVEARKRENGMWNQWNSRDILKWMKPKLPRDAYAVIAVTMTDLYPDEEWNFVFGQASFKGRVGVFSFARYRQEGEESEYDMDTIQQLRAGKVLTHEMGHMFGIKHCIHYECNMNGANHLLEMDSTPLHLCPICLRKLNYAVGFDPVTRYEGLSKYYEKHKLKKEHEWVEQRLKEIKTAK